MRDLKTQSLAAGLLLSILAAAGYSEEIEAPASEPNEFHFVVLGDAQFHSPAKFNRIIDQTRRLQPAFVIQVGDLIEGYNSNLTDIQNEWDRFAQQIAPLGDIAYYPVPGNHDLYGGNKKVDKRLERIFVERWGPLYFSFTYKNTLIIGLNTDSTAGTNRITGRQLKWFENTLAASQATHKFVFMHRPAFLLQNAREMHALFAEHDVDNVIYGHHHHYHFSERDGVGYTMTNATGKSAHDEPLIGGFSHLLQVSVRGGDVEVAVIPADAVKPRDAVIPIDNYDFFALDRGLVPRQVTLDERGKRTFGIDIPLNNTSERDVQLLVSCSSLDNRWTFSPAAIPPLALTKQSQETLMVTASFAADRVPESLPVCTIRVPFQTGHGEWIEFARTVTTVHDKKR